MTVMDLPRVEDDRVILEEESKDDKIQHIACECFDKISFCGIFLNTERYAWVETESSKLCKECEEIDVCPRCGGEPV